MKRSFLLCVLAALPIGLVFYFADIYTAAVIGR